MSWEFEYSRAGQAVAVVMPDTAEVWAVLAWLDKKFVTMSAEAERDCAYRFEQIMLRRAAHAASVDLAARKKRK